jgi:hypothetical protein
MAVMGFWFGDINTVIAVVFLGIFIHIILSTNCKLSNVAKRIRGLAWPKGLLTDPFLHT